MQYMKNNISCTSCFSDDIGLNFDIQGSQHYKVIFNKNIWTCTCPDFIARYKWCKHIYYVLLIVLNMEPPPEDDSNAMRYGHRCNFARKRTIWFVKMCNPKIVYEHYEILFPIKVAFENNE